VKVGDPVEVKVLDVDLDRERISLGLKQTQPDPWQELVQNFPVGAIIEGKVTKLVPFGAFVELGETVEGLVHISEMAKGHVETPDQVTAVGETVHVKVQDIDLDRRRISLSMRAAAEDLGIEIVVPERESVEGEEDEVVAEVEGVEAEVVESEDAEEAPAEEPAAEEAAAEEPAAEEAAAEEPEADEPAAEEAPAEEPEADEPAAEEAAAEEPEAE
jgi:small subunit ribosomal protein S1